MIESHFQWQQRPFLATPRVDRYFAAGAIEAARQAFVRCVDRAEGVGLLIGPAGTGKTLLLEVLAEQFRGQFAVVTLSNSNLTTRRALLQAILYDLGLPYRDLDEGELRLALVDYLVPSDRCPHGLLLLIDEAHLLPMRLFEEVRMITNLTRAGQPRVRLVLAGSHLLEEHFASPKLAALSQRVTARCYLQSMTAAETAGLVRHQIAAVGGNTDDLFDAPALEAIFRATDGVPRLINQLCDHALVLAFADNRPRVDMAGIEQAWADLQQLPTPWNERSQHEELAIARRADDVVEFGTLDEPADPAISVRLPLQDARPTTATGVKFAPAPAAVDYESMYALDGEADEFDPNPTVRPEAELVFSDSPDPFGAGFREEEVLFDRYASADETLSVGRRVRSSEGKLLAAMLDPFTNPIGAQHRSAASEPVVSEHGIVASPAALNVWAGGQAEHESNNESEVAPSTGPVVGEGRPVEQSLQSMKSVYSTASDAPSSDNDDMILIDDDPAPSPGLNSPAEVRRQEFGRLFASLRRG